ncbi:IclR family transcriptional regulator [Haloarcula amylovorans]|uniref:IclR family transcriptional regulator n=1 Tax=Haloarcula amylovorans TaxID=2562280 RepID=UPI0014310C40|nr:IclR family transcriptional regulator [Halomicroarcula amylolytica]
MTKNNKQDLPIKSPATMLEVLQELQDRKGAGITELAESLDISKSTVHNHLTVLRKYEYVKKDGDTYELGLRFLDHAGHALERREGYDEIKQKVSAAAAQTGELCQYLVEDHGRGIFIIREAGQQAVETRTRLGTRAYLHHVTSGKTVLAHMSDATVEEIINRHGLPPKTHQTITTREDLFEELDHIREQGYAYDKAEHVRGLHAIAVPVRINRDQLLGSMSVAGPSHRINDKSEDIIQLLQGLASELELNLSYGSE